MNGGSPLLRQQRNSPNNLLKIFRDFSSIKYVPSQFFFWNFWFRLFFGDDKFPIQLGSETRIYFRLNPINKSGTGISSPTLRANKNKKVFLLRRRKILRTIEAREKCSMTINSDLFKSQTRRLGKLLTFWAMKKSICNKNNLTRIHEINFVLLKRQPLRL